MDKYNHARRSRLTSYRTHKNQYMTLNMHPIHIHIIHSKQLSIWQSKQNGTTSDVCRVTQYGTTARSTFAPFYSYYLLYSKSILITTHFQINHCLHLFWMYREFITILGQGFLYQYHHNRAGVSISISISVCIIYNENGRNKCCISSKYWHLQERSNVG
jgi:hypothetical protein